MKLLIITNLFPNKKEPNRAVFNVQQIRELLNFCEIKVVAPIPFLKYSKEHVPYEENIKGVDVYHPRYVVIPKILRSLYGYLFFLGIKKSVLKIYQAFKFDMILATWAYPDAFGAAIIAKILKKPLVVKVHGTDINVATRYFWRRKMIRYAFCQAEKIIAVSQPLKEKIIALGIPAEKIVLIPNGVDTQVFHSLDKKECRAKLSLPLDKRLVVFVGNLEKIKGIDVLVEAMAKTDEQTHLIVVGRGQMEQFLKKRAGALAIKDRIHWVGSQSHKDIPLYMNAADVFCLSSRNEGCPNVVLEALACGVPVVASRVGGVPDLVSTQDGILVESEDPEALAEAIQKIAVEQQKETKFQPSFQAMSWAQNAQCVFECMSYGTK